MPKIDLSADALVRSLLRLSATESICLLDSCGSSHQGSHLLVAGVRPKDTIDLSDDDPDVVLAALEKTTTGPDAAFFTLSYDLGLKLAGIRSKNFAAEPDAFISVFDCLVVHDYRSGETFVTGNELACDETVTKLMSAANADVDSGVSGKDRVEITSNFSKAEYLIAIGKIKQLIRQGETYQTNLIQKLRARIPDDLAPQVIFQNLRTRHPAPFAAFIQRNLSTVISASPERFIKIDGDRITASPIKGTRPRGNSPALDDALRDELFSSEKDIAENTMIVDLLRNDIGRVCRYGSVRVKQICEIEEHPSLFHLVSTIEGRLCDNIPFSEVLRAVFPCGSITGAPKHRTMQIIDRLEPESRGLSMGAIGYYVPAVGFHVMQPVIDMSVAIRTMVIRDRIGEFGVGGGIVIDSDAESEYQESLIKAKAIILALGGSEVDLTSEIEGQLH